MNLRVCPAEVGHSHAIASLLVGCIPDCVPLSQEQVRARIGSMVVALTDLGKVVGCAGVRASVLGHEVSSVAVADGYRSCGVGTRLVEAVLDRFGGPHVCVSRNPEFFRHLGFELSVETPPPAGAPVVTRPRFVLRRP